MKEQYVDYSALIRIETEFRFFRQENTPYETALKEATAGNIDLWRQVGDVLVTYGPESRIDRYLDVFQDAANSVGLTARRIFKQAEGEEPTPDLIVGRLSGMRRTALAVPSEYVSQFKADGKFLTALAERSVKLANAGRMETGDLFASFFRTALDLKL